jgi:RNA recognition motif-containing protein
MPLTTLYVGNLSWETSLQELEEVFSEYGRVANIRIITDAQSGRSKGFAFIEMHTDAALQAIASIHGAKLRGRALVVAPAKDRLHKMISE